MIWQVNYSHWTRNIHTNDATLMDQIAILQHNYRPANRNDQVLLSQGLWPEQGMLGFSTAYSNLIPRNLSGDSSPSPHHFFLQAPWLRYRSEKLELPTTEPRPAFSCVLWLFVKNSFCAPSSSHFGLSPLFFSPLFPIPRACFLGSDMDAIATSSASLLASVAHMLNTGIVGNGGY